MRGTRRSASLRRSSMLVTGPDAKKRDIRDGGRDEGMRVVMAKLSLMVLVLNVLPLS
jgi:hypothetical protein